ncbi:TIGR03905 family TSCPD domain-containing protein [Caproiciproducens galactitolivorans]|uniref:TIGR03905 family TSCPD domain-containing protein n=1 Tax=Caproiciproducens galactitolivorans TaxID=642589 RepID=UPI00108305C8|nr:TIGR03905 family TSCPD domain-containing protein [Caproiciproducens galactitolivorans]QEY34289.1 TIGR03905 family TSCPD domain-containing protein [Caproiciproducens galactitolivorans]
MNYRYKTRGTCSTEIVLELNGDIIKSVEFVGGCNGNTKGVAALVKGMKAEEVIDRLKGIKCGFRPTSCPDQLAVALSQVMGKKEK